MGEKHAKRTPAATEEAEALADDLAGLGDAAVTHRAMFGGYGIFADGVMFALVDSQGTAFLRTDEETERNYDAFGSEPHDPMPYHSIPPNIRANPGELRTWAAEALEVARAAKK